MVVINVGMDALVVELVVDVEVGANDSVVVSEEVGIGEVGLGKVDSTSVVESYSGLRELTEPVV